MLSESRGPILCGIQDSIFTDSPHFFSKTFQKTIDKTPKKCGASRPYL
jgi:hypothetical protein